MSCLSEHSFSNHNAFWASLIAETFSRCGGSYAVISPGSRSAPLAFAFATHQSIEAISVLDERAAGFTALGIAKWEQQPVALICTSGTAAANYMPAIIEASESGIPLFVLTADRPPEMRYCQSGQAIDQVKLYGDYVRFHAELALADTSPDCLRHLRQSVIFAMQQACTPDSGPVHLNIPFREPLSPVVDDSLDSSFSQDGFIEMFFEGIEELDIDMRSPNGLIDILPESERGIIVIGPHAKWRDAEQFTQAIGCLAADRGWPILDGGLSPFRGRATDAEALVTHFECLLRNEIFADEMQPDVVLCIGGWPSSKTLRGWIAESDPQVFLVGSATRNLDALQVRTTHFSGFMESLDVSTFDRQSDKENEWISSWSSAEGRASRAIAAQMESGSDNFEGCIAWCLSSALPNDTPLFVASSMPVRDIEYFLSASSNHCLPFSNRGANGIDGTIATAAGLAHAARRHVILLVGDLAFLHDLAALSLCHQLQPTLTIILINNNGGGIFETLPIAAFEDVFETYFAIPQNADVEALVTAYGLPHQEIKGFQELAKFLSQRPSKGTCVLELKTDRKQDVLTRRQILDFAASQI